MSKKRYEVKGMMEWHPEFKVGRTRLQVSFTGGHLCGGAATPASFETSDPVVQAVIERSVPFRSGRIRLIMESGRSDCCASGAAVKMTAPHNGCVFEYRNIDDVSDFLQFEKGVSLDRLNSEDACFEEAKKLGVILKKKSP